MHRWRPAFLGIFLTVVPALAPAQNRGVINVWTARALATVLAEVGHDFEKATGYRLQITTDLPTGFDTRYRAGEQFDLLITASAALDEWIRDGRVAQDT